MSGITVTKLRFRAGVWEGLVTRGDGRPDPPAITVTLEESVVPGTEMLPTEETGSWRLVVPVPTEAIGDAARALVIRQTGSDRVLACVALLCGDAATGDLRAEMALLRAEMDLMKRALRRMASNEP